MESRDQLQGAFGMAYTIECELGTGGMATVYLARDHKHDRDVAIKVLRPDLAQTLGAERFLREIQLAAKLSHPHILPLFDSGDAKGALYFVMPRVEGCSVRDRLDEMKVLPVSEAVRIAAEVAGALDYAHRHGIVHRDIKPENIMLQDGHALVADFGIGKAASDVSNDTLTQAGMSVGTPAYMSPEQAVGETVDGRSDIYSLGCVLYEMLVGEPPFTGPNMQAVIAKRFVQTPADVTALRDGIPRAIARAVQTALARTPIDRYHTAAEMVAALNAVDSEAAPTPRASAPTQSIAVLPFVNLSTDRENDYFGDGIAEDIINALSQVNGLHVAARMSAFSFKGKNVELRTVGEQLNVATVLQGSVRKAGARIRITTQLMAVDDGYQLWSERYDRELVDVFAVQDEIAGAIATRLQLTFAPATAASRATTSDVEAYELVARGRALTAQRGRSILEALDCFERAIELAPDSAAAHAGRGNALRVKAQYGFASADECLPVAQAELEHALEIDPENGEAMGHLGTVLFNEGSNKERVFQLWERSLALDPRLSEIRALYGAWGLAVMRNGAEDARATAELERAIADDPRNPICWAVFAMGMALMGNHEKAVAGAKRGCEIDPAAFAPRYALAWTQTWARETDDGLATTQGAIEQFGRHPFLLQTLTGLYAQKGDRIRAEAVHAELEARALTSRISFYSRATSAMYLGRIDEAIEHAIRSAELRDAIGPMWLRWPDLESLRAHPRYAEVIAKAYATKGGAASDEREHGSMPRA